jgi:hypothetical protein
LREGVAEIPRELGYPGPVLRWSDFSFPVAAKRRKLRKKMNRLRAFLRIFAAMTLLSPL